MMVAVGRHSVRAVCEARSPSRGAARSSHPAVLIAVPAAAGISVSVMQTLIIPLIPELPALLQHQPSQCVMGDHRDAADRGGGHAALTSSLVPFIVGRTPGE